MQRTAAARGQALPGGERAEDAVAPPFEADRGANPQAALAILEDRVDGGGGLRRAVHPRQAIAAHPDEPARCRAHPDVPVTIARHRQHARVDQRLGHAVGRDRVPVPARDAGVGADPELAAGTGQQDVDLLIGEHAAHRPRPPAAGAEEARVPRPQPHLAVGALGHRDDERAGHDVLVHHRFDPPGSPGEHAVIGHGEQDAVPRRRQGGDDGGGDGKVERQRFERAVSRADEHRVPELRPQAAVAVGRERQHARRLLGRQAGRQHQPERRAVEAHESAIAGNPEVAVGCLRDPVDGAARKPVGVVPGVAQVLRHVARGVERLRRAGPGERATDDDSDEPGAWSHGVTAGTRTVQRRPRRPPVAAQGRGGSREG